MGFSISIIESLLVLVLVLYFYSLDYNEMIPPEDILVLSSKLILDRALTYANSPLNLLISVFNDSNVPILSSLISALTLNNFAL